MSNLVIVESPNKVKTIKKYLGDDYEVMSSVGHIVKMPASGVEKLGIDFENWEPVYKIEPDKREVVSKLKAAAKKAKIVYIATDPDREGEAIGDNLVEFLDIKKKYKRIKYNEITKQAVLHSLENPTVIDENLVNAQKSRRMLDRIIGFKLTNLMAAKMTNYTVRPTAGRVQSIALKLVVDRENEIKNFVPVYYSKIEAIINEQIKANLYNQNDEYENKEWITREKAEEIYNSLKGDLKVVQIKTSSKNDAKVSPLKQAHLYKKADTSSKAVQSAAQRLYEGFGDGGLISYPRTDSTRLSETFLKTARAFVDSKYGKEYIADDIKGISGDQDAHEAIRPTDISLTPEQATIRYGLNGVESKIYSLIYYTTLKAIMKPPRRDIIRYELESDNGYQFKMSSSKVVFDGYLILSKYEHALELPKYNIGDVIKVAKFEKTDHETKPPARYTDGSLIEKLDEIKVGRPSTFATTVAKVIDREFVVKEGSALRATEFGEQVLNKLIDGFPNEINEDYTARVEMDLDLIAEGQVDYKFVMQDFWERFDEAFKTAQVTLEQTFLIDKFVGEKCPECANELVYKKSRKTNEEFIGCSNFPECKFTRSTKTKKSRFGFIKKQKN